MENTKEENQSQPCLHCGDKSGTCAHVKLDDDEEPEEEDNDNDFDDDEEMEDSDVPECPYCNSDKIDLENGCPHVLLDYDRTFSE